MIKEMEKEKKYYFNGTLKFEGEYLNGKKNGKGKKYKEAFICGIGPLIFEGEYFNGKKNGKGKEYDDKGQLIFEGIFLNGNRWNKKK